MNWRACRRLCTHKPACFMDAGGAEMTFPSWMRIATPASPLQYIIFEVQRHYKFQVRHLWEVSTQTPSLQFLTCCNAAISRLNLKFHAKRPKTLQVCADAILHHLHLCLATFTNLATRAQEPTHTLRVDGVWPCASLLQHILLWRILGIKVHFLRMDCGHRTLQDFITGNPPANALHMPSGKLFRNLLNWRPC